MAGHPGGPLVDQSGYKNACVCDAGNTGAKHPYPQKDKAELLLALELKTACRKGWM